MLMWVYHDVDPAQSRLCPVIALADASASVAWKMWPQNDRKLPHIPTLNIQYIQISLTYSSEVLALYLFFFRWSQGGKSACIIKLHRVSGSDSTWIIQFYLNCLPPLLNGSALKLNMQLSSADVTLAWHEAQNNGVFWGVQVSASHVYQKILFDRLSVMDMIMTLMSRFVSSLQ